MRTARFGTFPCLRGATLALLAAFLSAPTLASDPPPVTLPAWEQLTPAQREQLIAPVRERWNAEPAQRARLMNHAQRWRQMTPQQRRGAHRGMRHWEHLSTEQREQLRVLFEHTRGLPPQQREAIKKRWRQMTPEQRKTWAQEQAKQP